jgi:hypothetical protein
MSINVIKEFYKAVIIVNNLDNNKYCTLSESLKALKSLGEILFDEDNTKK